MILGLGPGAHDSISFAPRSDESIFPITIDLSGVEMGFGFSPKVQQEMQHYLSKGVHGITTADGMPALQRSVGLHLRCANGHADSPSILAFRCREIALRQIWEVYCASGKAIALMTPCDGSVVQEAMRTGAPVHIIKEDDWERLGVDVLTELSGKGVTSLYLEDPCMFRDGYWSEQRRLEFVESAWEVGITIIADESWSDTSLQFRFKSLAAHQHAPQSVISLYGISKGYSLAAEPITTVACQDEGVMDRILEQAQRVQDSYYSPTLSQLTMSACMDKAVRWNRQMVEYLSIRRYQVMDALAQLPFRFTEPMAGSMIRFQLPEGLDSRRWCDGLLHHHKVRLLPLHERYALDDAASWVAINFAVSEDLLEEALERILDFHFSNDVAENRAA